MIPNPSAAACLLLIHATHSSAISAGQNHASNHWWSRLTESLQNDPRRPANRRSPSATVYRRVLPGSDGGETREWMVVSGGFTDGDWTNFPVWAFDLTNARSVDEETGDGDRRRPWIDLTGLDIGVEANAIDSNNEDAIHTPFNASYYGPQGRVGHLSSVYNDCLFIFGGLTYSLGTFHVENESGEDESRDSGGSATGNGGDGKTSAINTMIVWKACGLHDLLTSEELQQKQQADHEIRTGLLKWEKIIPRVDTSIFIPSGHCDQDKSGVDNDSAAQDAAKDSSVKQISRPEAANTISRGEAQGGHYSINRDGKPSPGDCFILFGGIHRQRVAVLENGANPPSIDNEAPLGDVWKFDYETETLSLLAPYPPLECQRDHSSSKSYPMARTSHSGTIVGDRLIIHGGMGSHDEEKSSSHNDEKTSSFLSSSSYATYKTSPKWIPLADTWEFDLKTLRWRERVQYPQLARSYHSLVGWPDGRVAAFGGFQQDNSIGGETVAFVFKDVIVSRANETHWLKLQPPFNDVPNWGKYRYKPPPGIPNRLEHTAVVDQFGSMYVWGGRFQTVHQVSGVWRLDLFNSDANLQYDLAEPDGIEQYEAELETLHLFIATMMFVSLSLSSFFSMMQQRHAREAAEEGNATAASISPRRGGGLTRQVIDSLPLKHYEVGEPPKNSASADSPRLDESECCPICLIEYEEGCEVRSLPCRHDFCRVCIDPWLESHRSCPACRQLVDCATVNESSSSSWAVTIGRMYSPNRRGYRHTRSQEQRLNNLVEGEASDNSSQADSSSIQSGDVMPSDRTDELYSQGAPSARLTWFYPILRSFSRTGYPPTLIPNDAVEVIELI